MRPSHVGSAVISFLPTFSPASFQSELSHGVTTETKNQTTTTDKFRGLNDVIKRLLEIEAGRKSYISSRKTKARMDWDYGLSFI